MQTFGRVAFEGYSKDKPWASSWDALDTAEKVSWEQSGRAVLDFLLDQQQKMPAQYARHD